MASHNTGFFNLEHKIKKIVKFEEIKKLYFLNVADILYPKN